LGDVVDALKEFMRLDGVFDLSHIIFVAHSMGGIVVRKLLVERAQDFIAKNIAIGLFLVASPSLGSRYATMLEPFAQALGQVQADALRFSEDNAWLMDLDKEFTNLKEAQSIRIVGKELVEDVFFIFRRFMHKQVVEPFSGLRYFGEPIKIPGSDHFSIVKPASNQDLQHRLLLRFIIEARAGAAEVDIDPELLFRLQSQATQCRDAGLPFRTYYKLAVVLRMSSRFAASCFDRVGAGTGNRVAHWLDQSIAAAAKTGTGNVELPIDLKRDPALLRALSIAQSEGAKELDERHLFLAILEDAESGTIAELTRSLGQNHMVEIRKAAQQSRPERPGCQVSQVLPLADGG
jgi:hypothetical protein